MYYMYKLWLIKTIIPKFTKAICSCALMLENDVQVFIRYMSVL